DEVEPGRGREQLHRPVVVCRAEPSGDDAEVGLQALAERGRELPRHIADDRDPCGREPERQELPRQKRPVQIGALAAHELAAGDGRGRRRGGRSPRRHGRTRPAELQAAITSEVMPVITTSVRMIMLSSIRPWCLRRTRTFRGVRGPPSSLTQKRELYSST